MNAEGRHSDKEKFRGEAKFLAQSLDGCDHVVLHQHSAIHVA